MSEHYRIERVSCRKKPDKKLAEEMIHWGRIMGHLRMAPYVEEKGWAGNMGFRKNETIWVTSSGGAINDTQLEDIIGIAERKGKIVFWGNLEKKPTSEWEIYWAIFKKRQGINAILHGHDLFALETAEKLKSDYPKKIGLTKNVTDAGSPEFRDEILEILTESNFYLIGKDHGFFALGKTFYEAGELALEFRSVSNELIVGKERYKKLLEKYRIG